MTASLRARPDSTEFKSFYAGYVASVPEGDIVDVIRAEGKELAEALAKIPESKGSHRYAADKWTVKTLIGHMIDAERIFTYRALRIARGDSTPLPGFDENAFAETAGSDTRTVADLAAEMACVREATVRIFASFPDDVWSRRAVVNNGEITVRAIAYVATGHTKHHLAVLRERYGV